jgi:divalent metal cation (Fe/Co/Zn/Cd) transporter|tara:strand:- start:501 stop:1472 length:972 start_codon:yes stop_codon:yes gene_type:complete
LIISPDYEFTSDQKAALKKARVLCYLSIAYLTIDIFLMYLVMGSSQAMQTAWVEDFLSLIPPVSFILGSYLCWRRPTKHYPYGFHRVISVLFLCAALALLLMGSYLFVDALIGLGLRERPTIGMKAFFGIDLWLGWWMILVLLLGTLPPFLLGRAKLSPAIKLNDKILYTDGKMNKADWLTAIAAIAGVAGIGMGWWWADSAAAMIISFDILKDGWRQSKNAVTGLLNRAPTSVDNKFLDLPEKIEDQLRVYHWVSKSKVRLYEQGHLFFGEAFICPKDNSLNVGSLRNAMQDISKLDWRLQSISLTVDPDYEGGNDQTKDKC